MTPHERKNLRWLCLSLGIDPPRFNVNLEGRGRPRALTPEQERTIVRDTPGFGSNNAAYRYFARLYGTSMKTIQRTWLACV